MIAIDNILVSDAVVQDYFTCNLNACKGACCVEGESGAPLETEELEILEKIYPLVKPYLTEEGISEIESKGFFTHDKKEGYKTPLINNGACAYIRYENDIAQCGIQKAWREGKVDFEKPISCHLYPIRVTKSRSGMTHVNYEQWDICKPGCALGEQLKMPLYQFVKEALVRKFGEEFYVTLDLAATRT